MTGLSDSFPDSFKKDFSERNLSLGAVLKFHDTNAGKEKIHIIVGFNSTKILTATVRINSEINHNVFRTPYLEKLCYHIKKKNYSFLSWDSIVDCSQLLEWPTEKLKNNLAETPEILQGNIDEKEFDTIRSILATARTIEPKKRKKFGLE